jgi:hypothetical protein
MKRRARRSVGGDMPAKYLDSGRLARLVRRVLY